MKYNLRLELEEYIDDWHCDIETYESAVIIGKFIFSFMDYLDDQNIPEKTKKQYKEMAYLVGMFETQYGYNNDFHAEDIECINSCESEFKRTIAYSKSELGHYKTTWKKLKEYVSSNNYESYIKDMEEVFENLDFVNDVIDFNQAVHYLKIKESDIRKELKNRTAIIQENYVEFEDCVSKEAFNKQIIKAWKETEVVCGIVDSISLEEKHKKEVLRIGKELMSAFYELVNN